MHIDVISAANVVACFGGPGAKNRILTRTEIKQFSSLKRSPRPPFPPPPAAAEVQVITSIPHSEVGDRLYSLSTQPAVMCSEFKLKLHTRNLEVFQLIQTECTPLKIHSSPGICSTAHFKRSNQDFFFFGRVLELFPNVFLHPVLCFNHPPLYAIKAQQSQCSTVFHFWPCPLVILAL